MGEAPSGAGVKDFEPGELRMDVIGLLTAVHGIRATLESARAGNGDDLNVAEQLAGHAHGILASAFFIRETIWDSGKGLLDAVDRPLGVAVDPGTHLVYVTNFTEFGNGTVSVIDGSPNPTSRDQCTKGGWVNYPQFKNEGQCVASLYRNNG